MTTSRTDASADAAKRSAAFKSVTAAVGLTATKLVVGVLTGSLGIIAEAAHSGLDLVAAGMTYFAVSVSGRPPDRSHHYGHGKVENLSALFETLLLLATCAWIVYESVERLVFRPVHVDANAWSFLVMAGSIVVDVSRSRMLARAAKKYHSQALEADALHFETDIWSSAVVLVGLTGVVAGDRIPSLGWLGKADAVAALVVAMIVVGISARLGHRTLQALVDAAPEGIEARIATAAMTVPGILDCHQVRARYSGPQLFVDIHITVDGAQTLREAHDLADDVERAIHDVDPGADVTVHPEPGERQV
jgi:cation diffusion facilitator family transporter